MKQRRNNHAFHKYVSKADRKLFVKSRYNQSKIIFLFTTSNKLRIHVIRKCNLSDQKLVMKQRQNIMAKSF